MKARSVAQNKYELDWFADGKKEQDTDPFYLSILSSSQTR